MFERIFSLKESRSTGRTEAMAGITTFMTMVYILAVNPMILSQTGMDAGAVFTATVLSSVIAMLVMAFYANLPIALAPGMGLNAFFAYTVVIKMGYSWEMALTAVCIEGIMFILLSFFNVREAIVNSIPINLKHAISVGIGLFIAFIGLKNAGVITASDTTLVTLGDMTGAPVLLTLAGIVIIGVLLVFRIRAAIIIGMVIIALAGIPLGVTVLPEGSLVTLPPSVRPVFMHFDLKRIWEPDFLVILFTFLFIDVFDTVGTLVGVCSKAGLLDKEGRVPRVRQALLADAIGTAAGAVLGTSTVTSYVESAAGVTAGGKTGLTTLVVALLFLLALFFSPLFLMIPGAATAPALIVVGLFMISPIRHIDLEDYSEAIPVFLTIIMMPLTSSISEGIMFGILSYVLIKVFTGRFKEVSWVMLIISILFILKHIFI